MRWNAIADNVDPSAWDNAQNCRDRRDHFYTQMKKSTLMYAACHDYLKGGVDGPDHSYEYLYGQITIILNEHRRDAFLQDEKKHLKALQTGSQPALAGQEQQ